MNFNKIYYNFKITINLFLIELAIIEFLNICGITMEKPSLILDHKNTDTDEVDRWIQAGIIYLSTLNKFYYFTSNYCLYFNQKLKLHYLILQSDLTMKEECILKYKENDFFKSFI